MEKLRKQGTKPLFFFCKGGGIYGKKILKSDLSIQGINRLCQELEKYRDSLTYKARLLAEKLAEIGIKVAEAKIGESPLGKYVTIKTDITEEQAVCRAILIATGETFEHEGYAPFNSLLAIEFGAGIRYNSEENPKAPDLGFGVGTFPDQTHAFDKNGWWFWSEEKQAWIHSYGVKATMPMYQASMEIQQNIVKVAKEVFK